MINDERWTRLAQERGLSITEVQNRAAYIAQSAAINEISITPDEIEHIVRNESDAHRAGCGGDLWTFVLRHRQAAQAPGPRMADLLAALGVPRSQ